MLKRGDRVTLKRGGIPGYPITEVAHVDEQSKKALIRFSRPPGTQGYAYVFWRELEDVEGGTDDGNTSRQA